MLRSRREFTSLPEIVYQHLAAEADKRGRDGLDILSGQYGWAKWNHFSPLFSSAWTGAPSINDIAAAAIKAFILYSFPAR